jgi:parvulin-like peptidyl-prolyl isomerase
MKKNLIFFVLIFTFFVLNGWAQPIDPNVVDLKLHVSEAITQGQFRKTVEAMEKQMNRALGMDEKKQLLDHLINEKLLVQAAIKEKITVTDTEITQLKSQTKKLYEQQLGRAVADADFKTMVEQRGYTMDSFDQELRKQILGQKYIEKLLKQLTANAQISVTDAEIQAEAKKLYEQQLGRVMKDEEFNILMKQMGASWSTIESQVRNEILIQKYLKAKKGFDPANIPAPTDQEVSDYYYANQQRFVSPEMRRFKQIYINPNLLATQAEKDSAKKKAQTIVREIRAGASFDNYWEIYDETGRYKIGTIIPGVLRRDDQKVMEAYGKDFFDAVFSLNTGAVSDLIVSKAGYHIIIVLEKIIFKVLGIDDPIPPQNVRTVRKYIKLDVLGKIKEQDARQKALNDLVQEELRRNAVIKVHEEYLSW